MHGGGRSPDRPRSERRKNSVTMSPTLLADIILVFHFAYASFVVLGYAAIPLGAWRGWAWVRGRAPRALHLAAIALVGLEGLIGCACPLTLWEDLLRQEAGQGVEPGSFIGRVVSRMLYYDLQPWVFTVAYVLLTALAVGLWFWVPPRRRHRLPR